MARQRPSEKPLDYILQNQSASKQVLQHLADRGGQAPASEMRDFAKKHTLSDAHRDSVLNALYVCACIDRIGVGNDRAYIMTVHGQDLLDSFKKV